MVTPIKLDYLFFSSYDLLCGSYDIRGIQPVFDKQLCRCAAFAKCIVGANVFNGRRKMPGQRLCNRVAHSANHIVLFGGDSAAGLFDGSQDGLRIQRLDGMQVDELDRNAFFLEDLAGFDRFPDQVSAGKNSHIRSLGKDLGLPDLERQLVGEDGPYRPAETEVDGTLIIGDREGRRLGLTIVAGYDHGHAREHFHQADIFQDLVGGAVLTEGYTRMGGAYLYI